MRFREGVLIHGRALGSDGTPAAGATIDLLSGESLLCRVETDGRGRFDAPALPGKPHPLRAYGPPGAVRMMTEIQDVVPDGEPIEVRLAPRED